MSTPELEDFKVVRIGPSSISQAQSILYNAYRDNELCRCLLDADKPGYDQRLRSYLREDIKHHFATSSISVALAVGNRLIGCALIERAGDPLDFFADWFWRIAMYSTVGFLRTERLRRYFTQVREKLEGIDHYWITFVGIHPDYQHKGYGKPLIDAIHSECERDPDYHGICIDLSGPAFRTFFDHRGYRKIGEVSSDEVTSEIFFHPREGEECPFTDEVEQSAPE